MPVEKPSVYYLVKQLLTNREIGRYEDEFGKRGWTNPWSVTYMQDAHYYARYFGKPDSFFYELVDGIRSSGRMPFGLDVGSSTAALRSLKIPGIAIGLGDARKAETINSDAEHGRYVVRGDVIYPPTWNKVREEMKKRNIPGFDLALSVPVGGLGFITGNPLVHGQIAQEIWSLLNEEGRMYVQMKQGDTELSSLKVIEKAGWIDFLNTVDGIEASYVMGYRSGGIMLVKHHGAPAILPVNFTFSKEQLDRMRTNQRIHLHFDIFEQYPAIK